MGHGHLSEITETVFWECCLVMSCQPLRLQIHCLLALLRAQSPAMGVFPCRNQLFVCFIFLGKMVFDFSERPDVPGERKRIEAEGAAWSPVQGEKFRHSTKAEFARKEISNH